MIYINIKYRINQHYQSVKAFSFEISGLFQFLMIFFMPILSVSNNVYADQHFSVYRSACHKLGLTSKNEQESLLSIFNMSGYFEPYVLKRDITAAHLFNDNELVYSFINRNLDLYGSNRLPSDFDAELAANKIFGRNNQYMTILEAAKYILYLTQNAFNREKYQERYEIQEIAWMKKYKNSFLHTAQVLGLTNKITPIFEHKYYASLILGGGRSSMISRIKSLQNYKERGISLGKIMILTGDRALSAEIDGIGQDINSKTNNGILYLKYLCTKLDRCLSPRPVKIHNQTKLMDNNGIVQLNEKDMAMDLMEQLGQAYDYITDTCTQGISRPNTFTTALDASKVLLANIMSCNDMQVINEVCNILVISNNPFIARQALTVQSAFNKAKTITNAEVNFRIHGVGSKSNESIQVIHSEIAALLSELFMLAYPKISTKNLLYITR